MKRYVDSDCIAIIICPSKRINFAVKTEISIFCEVQKYIITCVWNSFRQSIEI